MPLAEASPVASPVAEATAVPAEAIVAEEAPATIVASPAAQDVVKAAAEAAATTQAVAEPTPVTESVAPATPIAVEQARAPEQIAERVSQLFEAGKKIDGHTQTGASVVLTDLLGIAAKADIDYATVTLNGNAYGNLGTKEGLTAFSQAYEAAKAKAQVEQGAKWQVTTSWYFDGGVAYTAMDGQPREWHPEEPNLPKLEASGANKGIQVITTGKGMQYGVDHLGRSDGQISFPLESEHDIEWPGGARRDPQINTHGATLVIGKDAVGGDLDSLNSAFLRAEQTLGK